MRTRIDDPNEFILDDPAKFSSSIVTIMDDILNGELARKCRLADKIDDGGATGDDKEQERVYDGFCEMVDIVLDLANMVRRREEFMIHHGYIPALHNEITMGAPTSGDAVRSERSRRPLTDLRGS
jgi:hypothetical protein